MIHLASSGLQSLPMVADASSSAGDLPSGIAPMPLMNSDSFSSLLPIPSPATLPSELPDAAIPVGEAGEILPPLPVPTLPGGNSLPASGNLPTVRPETASESLEQRNLNPPLAREDSALRKPAIDRLSALSQAWQAEVPSSPVKAESPQQTATQPEAHRQLSSLAMAAAQILSADKQRTSANADAAPLPRLQPKSTPTVKSDASATAQPTAPTKLKTVLPHPQILAVQNLHAKTPSSPPQVSSGQIAVPNELLSETKPMVTRPAAELTPQPQAQTAPSMPTAQPVATAENGPPQQITTEAKTPSQTGARPDQQATLDRVAEQTMQAREAATTTSTQIRLPHEQFGAIRMQLELAGAGLKVSLGNNDPGFAQSVQVALAERVSPVADTARADSNAARQDGSAPNGGQSTGGSHLGQSQSQTQAQPGPQNRDQPRDELTFGEALLDEQRAKREQRSDSSTPSQSGLFA